MEVGAVIQAYNNELILLKKNLNQAKIQVIHKLTRKVETLMKKKAPEHLKDKIKKKAELAVREVLAIKKIKPKMIGQFIVTHKGQLQEYLNRPLVDRDKACARLLLHKALQEKYKFIRGRFSDVPINYLFMSRQERLKLKQEAREQKKNKKDKKASKVINAHGDWDVEDVKTADNAEDSKKLSHKSDEVMSSDESSGDESKVIDNSELDQENSVVGTEINYGSNSDKDRDTDHKMKEENEIESIGDENESRKSVQPSKKKTNQKKPKLETQAMKHTEKDIEIKFKVIEEEIKKKQNTKQKDTNKNKNLKDKLLSRKFKKDSDEVVVRETRIEDPFFITSSGENYMSVAEPRQPDEVKEIHKQGNRQMRRAAMFGHIPKIKPRQNLYENNERYNRQNNYGTRTDNRHKNESGFLKETFIDNRGKNFKNNKFNKEHADGGPKHNFKDRNSQFKSVQEDLKPEKLHPSWEAKKKQSGILPFQGKKIIFSED